MNPEQNNQENIEVLTEKHPVFQVTKTSKYLALALFIIMPFIGGYIGYKYAPEKVVEVDKVISIETPPNEDLNFLLKRVNICGREFRTNDVYINGVNLTDKIDSLLRSDQFFESNGLMTETSSCEEFLSDTNSSKFLKIGVTEVNYDSYSDGSIISAEGYAVSFISDESEDTIDVGFYVNKDTSEVYRITVYDGSRGPKIGDLDD